jgi:hypothetical protein
MNGFDINPSFLACWDRTQQNFRVESGVKNSVSLGYLSIVYRLRNSARVRSPAVTDGFLGEQAYEKEDLLGNYDANLRRY